MKVLVFDTETTGLPASYNQPLSDLSKWPYVIQLSYIVFDTTSKEILDYTDHIIRLADDVAITSESLAIHQITKERSQRDGVPMQYALREFSQAAKDVDIIIGHNIQFDKNMLTVEFQRNKMKNRLYRKDGEPIPEYCTMKQTVNMCKIPFSRASSFKGYKWPSLSELHAHLFKREPKGTHNAIADVMICLRCYVYIQHGYDITADNDVKIVFRTLYSTYCMEDNSHATASHMLMPPLPPTPMQTHAQAPAPSYTHANSPLPLTPDQQRRRFISDDGVPPPLRPRVYTIDTQTRIMQQQQAQAQAQQQQHKNNSPYVPYLPYNKMYD